MARSRDYRAEFHRRNQLARERGFGNYWQQRKTGRTVGSKRDIQRLPVTANEARKEAARVVYLAHKGRISPEEAAERLNVPRARLWWVDESLGPKKGGQSTLTGKSPVVLRPLAISDEGGATVDLVAVRGPIRLARVEKAFDIQWREATGGRATPEELSWLARVRITGIDVISDPAELHDVARRGQFEDIGDSSGELTP